MRYRVAGFLLDRSVGSLVGSEGEVRLRPQAFRLFEVLVANAPGLLSVDELIDQSWDVDEDGAKGEAIGWAHESGQQDELWAMADRLVRSILGILDRFPSSRDRRLVAQELVASSSRSLGLFTEALEALGNYEPSRARAKLEQAVELDPDNAVLHENLAAVYLHLGMAPLAEETAAHAERIATNLPWELAHSASARAAETRGSWQRASELLRALCQRYPEDRGYGLRLATAWLQLGRPDEALEEIHRMREASGLHPSLDLMEVRVLLNTNQLSKAEDLVQQMAQFEVGEPASKSGVIGRQSLFNIHLRQGRLAEAHSLIESLTSSLAQLELRQRGTLFLDQAALLQRRGKVGESLLQYGQAEEVFRQLGDRGNLVGMLNRKAQFLLQIGERADARESLNRALELAREHGVNRGLIVSLCLMAQVVAAEAQTEEAAVHLEEARELVFGPEDPRRLSLWLRSAAEVHLAQGDLELAAKAYAECLTVAHDSGDFVAVSHAQLGLGKVARQRERFEAAQAHLRQAIMGFHRLGSMPGQLAARFELAEVELASGDLQAAAASFQAILETTPPSSNALRSRAQAGLKQVSAYNT